MKTEIKSKLLLVLLLPILFSCDALFTGKDGSSSAPRENFEYLWKECNEKYAYMDYKGINWNEVHDRYAAQITERMADDSLFNILGRMMNELKDGHVNLKSYFNVSHFDFERLGPDNFDFRLIVDHYLPRDYYVSGPFVHDFIANKKVAYVRLEAFTGTVSDNNLNFIINRYRNTDGMILDLRENGGGVLSDAFTLIGHLVDSKTHVYNTRIKSGKGKDDFTALEPGYVTSAGSLLYLKKVIVLTDRGTFSAGSFTTLAMKELKNVVVVGDTTGGGLGLPNGGQLPNGWIYRFSITQTLDLAGKNYESGVPPDVRVILKNADVVRGIDSVIEQALIEIYK